MKKSKKELVDENITEVVTESISSEKEQKDVKKKKPKKARTGFLKVCQHILITTAMVAILIVTTGSSVMVNSPEGKVKYSLSASDEGRKFENSVLFNTILGNETSNVLELVTICTQLENNGAYDPNIVIDVCSYNNRSTVRSSSDSITAKYYLGDLLKWARYGFEKEEVDQSKLSPSANSLIYNSYDGMSPDLLYEDSAPVYDLLINRYKTIDGYGVEEIATSWGDYDYLVNQIEIAANDLYINYSKYLKLIDYYKQASSNIRYCIVMNESTDPVIYTNTDIKEADFKNINSIFNGYGKYLSYNCDTMVYRTNTAINESTFHSLMSKYEYAYPDKCNIYIAADMSMPAVDAFATASRGFNNYLPYYKQLIGLIIACVLLYLIIFVVCTIKEGHKLNSFDQGPIEVLLLIAAGIFMGLGLLVYVYYDNSQILDYANDLYVRIIFGVCVFTLDIIILGLYYSLIRRIKTRSIWKNSLLKKLSDSISRGLLSIYDNGSIIIRSWVPFGILILLNIIILLLTEKNTVFIIVLFALDICAGIFIYKQVNDREQIIDGMRKIIHGDFSYKASSDNIYGDNKELAECVNSIGDSIRNAVEQSMKDERMKSDLVANVSHDIRTPLTSIINYVDLIKRENIDNPNIQSYINVIDEKSQRLKTLTDDLIEASKVSSGNVELNLQKMNLPELLNQSIAEFAEKFEENNLSCVIRDDKAQNTTIMADGKSLWRVMENLFGNICKYAMPGTRVFIDLFNVDNENKKLVVLQLRNMSSTPLPNDLSELTERFIRGDESRTTEGSGLGLSIAKSLTELMGGSFVLDSDADLFKVELSFDSVE